MKNVNTAEAIRQSLFRGSKLRPVSASEIGAEPNDHAGLVTDLQHWVWQLPTAGPPRTLPSFVPKLVDVTKRTSTQVSDVPDSDACLSLLGQLSSERDFGVDAVGRRWASRVAPSAGGTHSIQLMLMTTDAQGNAIWWRSEGRRAQRVDVALSAGLKQDLENANRAQPVKTCIVAFTEPDVLAARYPSGDSLLWRDAGATLATIQFTAMAYGLESRILGVCRQMESRNRNIPAYAVGAVVLTSRGASHD